MLRLLAEHEGYRYYMLLVDDLGAVTEWLPGPEHFSLFIYRDAEIQGHAAAQMDQLAQSAILAGAECIWCGGLMGSELDDIFDNEFLALKLGVDEVTTKDLFPDDYWINTLFNVKSSFEDHVWNFMNITDSEVRDRVAVFQKDDVIGKWYEKTLMAWINGELELTDDLEVEGD